jgi:4-amino-4-deoxychorismate lyase
MSDVLGTWIDGVAGASVPADDRGLQYGDGVFETILVRAGNPRFLDEHLQRMRRGLVQLGIQFLASGELLGEIARAVAMAPPLAILKIIITRGSTTRRGYTPAGLVAARRIVSLWETKPLEKDLVEKGAILRIARLRLPPQSPFAGIKHLNRLENVMAAAESIGTPCHDSLLLDTRDHVVSGTACNVFIVKSGMLLTPPVDRVGVAGVMRAIVLREAVRVGITAAERVLTMDDISGADGIFITNARIGVVPVQRVGEHVFPMNPIAARLAAHIEALDA